MIKTIESVMKELTSGTVVQFSYGAEDHKVPDLIGTVIENDGEENFEIKTNSGNDLILSYSIVHSILIQKTTTSSELSAGKNRTPSESSHPTEQSATQFLYQQEPINVLNVNDGELKALFDSLPRDDKKKLTRAYDSFQYGIKSNDRDKITKAANLAKQTLLREYDEGYDWAPNAARFCGFLLRRSHTYDSEVFLVGRCFYEAALAAYQNGHYSLAAAYAVLAMIESDDSPQDDLLILLSASSVKSNDMSGLYVLHRQLSGASERYLKPLIKEAFANKGIQVSTSQNIEDSLRILATLYTNFEAEEGLSYWLPEESQKEHQNDSQEEIIQLYCQKLIESIRATDYAGYDMKKTPPYVVTDDHLRRVMADREFVEQIHEKFEITLRLDQDQGSYYYPITLLIGWMYSVDPSKNGYSAKDVLYHAKDLAIDSLTDLNEEKIDALLHELRDLNILRNVSGNTYLLASKNFRDLLGTDEAIFEKLSKLGESKV